MEEAIGQIDWDKNITEQSEVDTMAQAIEDAVAALEKIEEQDKPGTEEPDPDKPGTEDPTQDKPGAGDVDQTAGAGNTDKADESSVPQTGDASNTSVWLLICIVSGAGFGVVSLWLRRKRQQAG